MWLSVVVDGSGCKWSSITIVSLDMVFPFMNVLYPSTSIHICPVTSYVENGQVFLKKKFKHKIRTACIKS